MLSRYAKENRFDNIKVLVDDGFTDTIFHRPGFQQLLEDIEMGYIATVIVKNLSRLGHESSHMHHPSLYPCGCGGDIGGNGAVAAGGISYCRRKPLCQILARKSSKQYESERKMIQSELRKSEICIEIIPKLLKTLYEDKHDDKTSEDDHNILSREYADEREQLKKILNLRRKLAAKADVSTATLSSAAAGNLINGQKAAQIAAAMGTPFAEVFVAEQNTAPLSSKTVLEHHRIISTVLAQAEKEMLIQYNPAAKATPPRVQRKAPDYYQPEDIANILDALDSAFFCCRVYLT